MSGENDSCVAAHDSNTIIKLADDTTVVSNLAVWCQDNNLSLNFSKTKELIADYRKWRVQHALIHINGAVVEMG
jgi:hypothetical protein